MASLSQRACRRRARHRTVVFALLTAGCTADPAADPTVETLRRESEAEGAAAPSSPPEPQAPPDCEQLLDDVPVAFRYPKAAQITAASASPDGSIVLAVSDSWSPELTYVRGSSAPVDLSRLLPESQREVSVLSRIQDGKILVAHRAPLENAPLVTAIDLRDGGAVRWTRRLQDLSGLPRPRFDFEGQRIEDWPEDEYDVGSVRELVYDADGRYRALVSYRSGVYLLGYEADGSFRFRTVLSPANGSGPDSLVQRADGSLEIMITLQGGYQKGFEALHGFRFDPVGTSTTSLDYVAVLSVTSADEITHIHDALASRDGAEGRAFLLYPPYAMLLGDRLTWITAGPLLSFSLFQGPMDGPERAVATPFDFRRDRVVSAAALRSDLYVAGRINGTTIPVKGGLIPGPAFIGRLAADGTMPWHCLRHADTSEIQGSPSSLFELHPTELPLLSIRTETSAESADEAPRQLLRVYRLPELVAR